MASSDFIDHDDADRDVLAIIEAEIANSICFDNDASSPETAIDASQWDRQTALDYYNGIMVDLPSDVGFSSAVSRDVSDTIDQQMPGLMRVFAGSSEIVEYQPGRPGEEEQAKQASEYVNYLWANECDGYLVLHTAVMDALQVRNGVIKAYWDRTPEYETQDLHGLSQEQVILLASDPSVQIIGHGVDQQPVPDPASGQTVMVPVYSLRIRRTVTTGRLAIEAVPPEDFGISVNAKTIDKARMVWHKTRPTRSDLIKQGFDFDIVDNIQAYTPSSEAEQSRTPQIADGLDIIGNRAMDELEVYECYPMLDVDGSGIAERRKVVVAGASGARSVLENEPWPDDLPFADLKTWLVPHRWMGKSTADNIRDVQRIKTVLTRQMLDNLYQVNNPRLGVKADALVDPDDVLKPAIGKPIRINKNAGSVDDALRWQVMPYIGDKALLGLQLQDAVIQRRTGVSPATAALDATALDPQTATAEQIDHDAGYARTELTARNLSQGLAKLFQKVLRIIVRNQDQARTISLRGKWVEFDPRPWNATMNCTVKIGLGTGSRERDLSMLGGVGQQQDAIVKELGPNNPIVTPQQYVATRHKMVEASGLRDPDQYFTPITNEQFQQWQQSQPPKPDPQMEKVKADAAATQAKQQGDAQISQQKLQQDFALQQQKIQNDYEVKMRDLEIEAQLKGVQIAIDAHAPAVTKVANP